MEKILSLGLTGRNYLFRVLVCSADAYLDGHGNLVASDDYSTGSVFSLDNSGLDFSITYFQKKSVNGHLGSCTG